MSADTCPKCHLGKWPGFHSCSRCGYRVRSDGTGAEFIPKPPYCHGPMVSMTERAGYICTGCGAMVDYEVASRAQELGFRLVRSDKSLSPEVVAPSTAEAER